MLVQGRYGDTLGGIRGSHCSDQVGFVVAAFPVLGEGVVCAGIGFHRLRFW